MTKMKDKILTIHSDYITLGQLLKEETIIASGGMAKWYLSEYAVLVNQEPENRRGKKLYHGDRVELPNESLRITVQVIPSFDEA